MSNHIVLYDIPGYATKDIAWSPNTWKVRYILNMKKLNYRTVWVEYPDIAQLYHVLGIDNVDTYQNGKPLYGLPVISDNKTHAIVAESQRIAHYLEDTYPSPAGVPSLFPAGTSGVQAMYIAVFIKTVSDPLHLITSVYAMRQLPPRSREYYSTKRSARYGMPLDEVTPPGSESRAAVWSQVTSALADLNKWMSMNGERSQFLFGQDFTFADVAVASYLTWLRRLLGQDSSEWQELMQLHDGRWAQLSEAFKPWEQIDQHGMAAFTNFNLNELNVASILSATLPFEDPQDIAVAVNQMHPLLKSQA